MRAAFVLNAELASDLTLSLSKGRGRERRALTSPIRRSFDKLGVRDQDEEIRP
jgi:hypothetical protein